MASASERRRWARRKQGQRDAQRTMFRRVFELRAEMDEKGDRVSCVAATQDPCDFGGYVEVLRCDQDSVDTRSAASVLLNHKSDWVVGRIAGTSTSDGKVVADLEINPEARMVSGVLVREAIRRKELRGISVGYEWDRKDCVRTTDEQDRTILTVNKWKLREISLTPIPADTGASVRSLPEMDCAGAGGQARTEPKEREMDQKTQTQAAPPAAPAPDVREHELNKLRAENAKAKVELERAQREAKIRALGEKHGVSADGLDFSKSDADLTTDLMARMAEQRKSAPSGSVVVDVVRDASDKANEAAVDGVLSIGQIREGQDKGMRGCSILEIGRRWLSARGVRSYEMNKLELAKALLGRDERGIGARAGAVSSGNFGSYVLVNAMDKAVLNAFNQFGNKTTYQIWTKRREVADFKTFYGGALSSGNLKKTTENVPFDEISKGEGGYSSALEMWGATVSLTLQALVNDDLNQFMAMLERAGMIAQRTIDKEVYSQLANATWTNRTFISGDLDQATLDKANKLLMDTAGPEADGEKLLVDAKYVIVPMGLRTAAYRIVDKSSANVAPSSRYYNDGLLPVVTPFLTTATTASQSTWYLAGDQLFEPVVVAFLQGISTPQIEEFDQGAVASRGWKIYLPFKAVVTPTYGIYQATNS